MARKKRQRMFTREERAEQREHRQRVAAALAADPALAGEAQRKADEALLLADVGTLDLVRLAEVALSVYEEMAYAGEYERGLLGAIERQYQRATHRALTRAVAQGVIDADEDAREWERIAQHDYEEEV